MFILYALPIGLVIGLLLGGRPARLGTLTFRWGVLAVAGLLLQVVLFHPAVTLVIGAAGVPLYVGSSAIVLVAVLANARTSGMPLVALGATSNLAAIVANGGYMPADPAAYAAWGREIGEGYSNSAIIADPALALLTDRIPLPAWLPFTNVISIGDVLIGLGVVVVMVVAMRRPIGVADPAPDGGVMLTTRSEPGR